MNDLDPIPAAIVPRRRRGSRAMSLGLAILMIAAVALAMGWYREYGPIEPVTYPIADVIPDWSPKVIQFSPYGTIVPVEVQRAMDAISAEIKSTIRPGSWDARGGRGTITAFMLDRSLIVRNNRASHRQIAELLDRKRREAGGKP